MFADASGAVKHDYDRSHRGAEYTEDHTERFQFLCAFLRGLGASVATSVVAFRDRIALMRRAIAVAVLLTATGLAQPLPKMDVAAAL